MNGINYNSLLNNTVLFSNQAANKDETIFAGRIAGLYKRTQNRRATDTRQVNADRDTYEYSGQMREVTAGYSRPKPTESSKYRALGSDGVQEGVELSDAAKDLLSELREKYQNMDISVAEWSTDEEQDYYAGLSSKEYSVLINPELLEKMAADPSQREEYESILSGAGDKFNELKEELGDDANQIKGFSITMDKDGNTSYAVKLLKDMEESSKSDKTQDTSAKKQQERIDKKRAERKKAEEEQFGKVVQKRQETVKVEASSIEDLVKAIREKLHPEQEENTNDIEQE